MYFSAHAHSLYSAMDGHCLIEDYVKKVKSQGHTHIGLTDHGTMAGLPELFKMAKKHDVIPVAGLEAYITSGDMTEKVRENHHLTLLAINAGGYQNLSRLSTESFTNGFYYKPRIDHDTLAQYSAGLVCLSGCGLGELAKAVLDHDESRAEELLRFYHEVFGERFFLEFQNHGNAWAGQREINRELYRFSRKYGIPAVGTNDSHTCNPEDVVAQKHLTEINTGNAELGSIYNWVRTNQEMVNAFGESVLVDNTLAIQEMVEPYAIGSDIPHLPISPWEHQSPDLDPQTILEHRVRQGLMQRLDVDDFEDIDLVYQARMGKELKVIEQMGQQLGSSFERYFLNIGSLTEFMTREGIRFGTRGSAAGSLVCWSIGISDLDPIKDDLMFERFLNVNRVSLPDIDLDHADDRRDNILQWIKQTYGEEYVSRIATYPRIGPKAALKGAAKLLGPYLSQDYQLVSAELVGMIPHSQNPSEQTLDECLYPGSPLDQKRQTDPEAKRIIDIAETIAGRVKTQGIHAAGIIVSDVPVRDVAPLMRVTKAETSVISTQTQFEMESLESIGLIKFDLLGLGELAKLDAALKLIEKVHGVTVDIDNLDWNDQQTWDIISSGATLGLFQLSKPGMVNALHKVKPNSIKELAMVLAIFRPGPMAQLDHIAKRKHGEEDIISIHPSLDAILAPTYGFPVYQEQIIGIVGIVAGYPPEEADEVRRAMGKKDTAKMAVHEERIKEQGMARGYSESEVEAIWAYIEPFAAYGFNRAHATKYSYAAYQSAWLKTHYPAEFYAAAMTVENRGGTDQEKTTKQQRIGRFIREARKYGIDTIPPSVEHPTLEFVPENGKVRYGMQAIKGLGPGIIDQICERPVSSLIDLVSSIPKATKTHFEALIDAGAIPWGTRADQHAQLVELLKMREKKNVQPRKSKNETKEDAKRRGLEIVAALFAEYAPEVSGQEIPEVEIIRSELRTLGVTYSPFPDLAGKQPIEDLETGRVNFNAMIAELRPKISRAKNHYAEIVLVDQTSDMQGVIWPTAWKRCQEGLKVGSYVSVVGIVDDNNRITVDSLRPLHFTPQSDPETQLLNLSECTPPEALEKLGTLYGYSGEGERRLTVQYWDETQQLIFDDANLSAAMRRVS